MRYKSFNLYGQCDWLLGRENRHLKVGRGVSQEVHGFGPLSAPLLLQQEHDSTADEFLGKFEGEKGPGRLAIWPAVHIRLTTALLERSD